MQNIELAKILTGQTREHLTLTAEGVALHRDCHKDFQKLQLSAAEKGFKLAVTSSFRDFQTQLQIWNTKALGKRALLDDRGLPLDYKSLSEREIIAAILKWSALPATSRHHWGTDLDVFDQEGLPSKDYQIQLTPTECNTYFKNFHLWLDEKILNNQSFGFFRPYSHDRGGVAPEPWHISYAPLSQHYLKALTPALIAQTLKPAEIVFKDLILTQIDYIHQNYILNVSRPPHFSGTSF